MKTIAILGGGNGGFAAAAHLQSCGHRTQLYNRSAGTISAIQERGGIEFSGAAGDGFAAVPVITTDLERAVADADLIMICLPAKAFSGLTKQLAALLDGTKPILLNPGSTGGALAVRTALQELGCSEVPPIAETNTLTYIARKQTDSHVHISSLVQNTRLATVPATAQAAVTELVLDLYPSSQPVSNVLQTSLSNVNAILHPPITMLSAAWIEHAGGDFYFYADAGTQSVASVMSDIDTERRAIARAWGCPVEPFPELFADIGSTSSEAGESGSFLRMLRESEPNKSIRAPASVDHRFFTEDIPFGLVPMSELGRVAGIDTPVIDSLITIACSINQTDHRKRGWTLEKLGLPAEISAAKRLL